MKPPIKSFRSTLTKGKLYIIPVPIAEDTMEKVFPSYNKTVICDLRIFVVEKLKTARQFLRKTDPAFPIDDSVFFEQDKHDGYNFHPDVIKYLNEGKSVGLMSESGYAGIADPGAKIVALAHDQNCEVIPLIGPSSLLLALAASGLNGQGFTFHGYLPKTTDERTKKLKEISNDILKTGFAHLFIETPYRNKQMFDELLKVVPPSVKLTVAFDVTGSKEKIVTKKIGSWKPGSFEFDKLPAVFILGA